MRSEFCETITEAFDCDWACEVIEVDGGWMAFESPDDRQKWEAQT
jgi:hypothetical protein